MKRKILFFIAGLFRKVSFRGKVWIWNCLLDRLKTDQSEWVDVPFPAGYELCLDLREHWQLLMMADCYDRKETWAIRNLLKSGDVFFDVGANAGYYTFAAASIVSSGAVYSFDPFPRTSKQILRSLERNPHLNIRFFQKAVSSSAGKALFSVPPDNGWQSVEGSLKPLAGFGQLEVQTETLDRIIDTEKIRKVQLLKIDSEGTELSVLSGARESLKSGIIESVLCEVGVETSREIFEMLKPLNFELVLDLRTMKPAALEAQAAHHNVLWLRGECFERWQKLKSHFRSFVLEKNKAEKS